MEAKEHSASATSRLKREDCGRTKHDSLFSDWQILNGHSDWENYSLGKEGTERYRIHNLPIRSGPGVYELGITMSPTNLGRNVRKLDPNHVIPVYLGQAENVRARLQDYGRTGSHLECGNSFGDPNENKNSRCGLFREIFSRGFPIVFRWVQMDNNNDAKNTEAQLLRKFDYAWNKGRNGARRPGDVLEKLDKDISRASRLQRWKWDGPLNLKKEGTRIKASKPESIPSTCTDQGSENHFAQMIKFDRSRPQLTSGKCVVTNDSETICGMALHDGSVSIYWESYSLGKEGTERYMIHNLPISGSGFGLYELGRDISTINLGRNVHKLYPNHVICFYLEQADNVRTRLQRYGRAGSHLECGNSIGDSNDKSSRCGVGLGDGSVCGRRPVEGRKRCAEHKGRRTNGSAPSLTKGGECYMPNLVAGEKSNVRDLGLESPFLNNQECHGFHSQMSNYEKLPYRAWDVHIANGDFTVCGVALGDGSVCRRPPVEGRKRCAEHKGRRTNGSAPCLTKGGECYMPNLVAGEKSNVRDLGFESPFPNHQEHHGFRSLMSNYGKLPYLARDEHVANEDLTICGVALGYGSVCRSRPVEGRKRCAEHKGMWANVTTPRLVKGGTCYMSQIHSDFNPWSDWACDDNRSSSFTPYGSRPQFGFNRCIVNEDSTDICGAATVDGSVCRRPPADGRKRCWQHKGRRAY